MKLAARLLNTLFPQKCPLCGALTDGGTARLCTRCTEKLAAEQAMPCPVCRAPAAGCTCLPPELDGLCTPVGGRRHLCIGFYIPKNGDSTFAQLIFSLKRRPDGAAAEICARLLAQELMRCFLTAGEDVRKWTFVFPPRSAEKKELAGFDHAERLARLLSKYTGGAYADVFRRRGGQEQKQLTEDERRENVRTSLTLAHPEKCRGKKVILIDDVLTSGATMAHCAALLRDAGTEAVFCASVLKTLPHKTRKAEVKNEKLWFEG